MERELIDPTKAPWVMLAQAAWRSRTQAHVHGDTKIGAALLTRSGRVFVGCNVGHRYRSRDVHAEENAITSMIAAGEREFVAIIIVEGRELMTPCGSCMDWIFNFSGASCPVGYQATKGGPVRVFLARELMPYYPNIERYQALLL